MMLLKVKKVICCLKKKKKFNAVMQSLDPKPVVKTNFYLVMTNNFCHTKRNSFTLQNRCCFKSLSRIYRACYHAIISRPEL